MLFFRRRGVETDDGRLTIRFTITVHGYTIAYSPTTFYIPYKVVVSQARREHRPTISPRNTAPPF